MSQNKFPDTLLISVNYNILQKMMLKKCVRLFGRNASRNRCETHAITGDSLDLEMMPLEETEGSRHL
jgi:hypothetical protein